MAWVVDVDTESILHACKLESSLDGATWVSVRSIRGASREGRMLCLEIAR